MKKKMIRLHLNKETLRTLVDNELGGAGGGGPVYPSVVATCTCGTCVTDCFGGGVTG